MCRLNIVMFALTPSIWLDIVHELELIKKQGIDLIGCIHKKIGNRANTLFWEDAWRREVAFKYLYFRVYALEVFKSVDVASKLSHLNLSYSFRREPRGGAEQAQYLEMLDKVEGTSLVNLRDRWVWSLEGSGEFTIASVRRLIDDRMLLKISSKTRWIKAVPIKGNIHAWKLRLDCLPTRLNISQRGMNIESILCPMCGKAAELTRHIFFTCPIAREVFCKISCWWEVAFSEVSSYEEWLDWIVNLRLTNKNKQLLEGIGYIMWWHIWMFHNKSIFGPDFPSKAVIFKDVVSHSFYLCRYRCEASFSWIDWLKNPQLVSL
ncbi:RNA-directed DNA polymerase, eukaryota, reverse transcriptase zinc-binding domain protein [Tanacetum coccineum]